MINRMVAERFFAQQDPVGRRFMFGRPEAGRAPSWVTIVGVVGDTKLYGLDNPARLEVYVPFQQSARNAMTLLVRSALDPSALTSAIRATVSSIDRDQPIADVATMRQLVDESVSTRRTTFVLLGLFSVVALVLAAIGIYGVMSYAVAQRTHEWGIRLALGAQGHDVLGAVLAQGLTIVGVGIVIGLSASAALTRLMTHLLFAVSAIDPVTFGAVAAGLGCVALLACYLPARRTLRVDPLIALRRE
jgi:putative ABC transport system permease protein